MAAPAPSGCVEVALIFSLSFLLVGAASLTQSTAGCRQTSAANLTETAQTTAIRSAIRDGNGDAETGDRYLLFLGRELVVVSNLARQSWLILVMEAGGMTIRCFFSRAMEGLRGAFV
eukprot:scaffold239580_cov37-Prasinocladus_malaysianus.AAC.2